MTDRQKNPEKSGSLTPAGSDRPSHFSVCDEWFATKLSSIDRELHNRKVWYHNLSPFPNT